MTCGRRLQQGAIVELQQRVSTLEKTLEELANRQSRASVVGAGELDDP